MSSITALPHKIYEDVLYEIIRNNLTKPLEEYEIIYSPGSSKGDNYIGVVYRVQVKDKQNGVFRLNLIVKLPPENQTRRSELPVNIFFICEADFYDKIYPMFRKFQEEKRIDVEKDGFHHVPFCYKSLRTEPHEGLFFDDLKAKGFEMFDRLKEVSKEQVFLVMKTLAKMHAIGFCIKDQKPKLFEPYLDLKDGWITMCQRENAPILSWFKQSKNEAIDVADKSENKEIVTRMKCFLDKSFVELLNNCHSRENTEPYATLCHGDCWNNNILFRYDKNGVPNDLRLLDFQIMKYSSPVCDLLYFIFCCTTKALRDKYYQKFMDVYHDELSTFIRRLGSDPEKIFPRKALDDHLKKFGYFGLLMAILVLPLFTSDAEDALDMDDLAENFKKVGENGEANEKDFKFTTEKTFGRYSERMMGVCEDMFRLGYL